MLCAGDVHEEQEITIDGGSNIREVTVINNVKKYLVKIPKVKVSKGGGKQIRRPNILLLQELISMKRVTKMMPLKKKPM